MFIEGMQSIIDNTNEVITTLGEGYLLANKVYGYLGKFNPFKKNNTKELCVNKENDIVRIKESELNDLNSVDISKIKYKNLVETTKKIENLIKENNNINTDISKDIDWIIEWVETVEGTSNLRKQNILANIFYYRIYQGIEYRKKLLHVIRYIEDKELDILYDISKYIMYLNEGPVIIRNLALKRDKRILEILKYLGLVDQLNDLYNVNSLGMVFFLDRYSVLYGFKNYCNHYIQLDTFVRLNELGHELFKNIQTEAFNTDFMDIYTELNNNINRQCNRYYRLAYRNVPSGNYTDYYGILDIQSVLANNDIVHDLNNYYI